RPEHPGQCEAIPRRELGRRAQCDVGPDVALLREDRAQDFRRASPEMCGIPLALAGPASGCGDAVEPLAHAALECCEPTLVEHLHQVALELVADAVLIAVHPGRDPV